MLQFYAKCSINRLMQEKEIAAPAYIAIDKSNSAPASLAGFPAPHPIALNFSPARRNGTAF